MRIFSHSIIITIKPILKPVCKPEEIALKSFFLGPQSENATWLHEIMLHVFRRWYGWRKDINPQDGRAITEENQLSDIFTERKEMFRTHVDELLTRFEGEVPSFSPRYIGHMVTEISMPALLGHIITLLHNPNNISGEASRVGLAIEKEAVEMIMKMVGFNPEFGYGHFTSGGTVANIEGAQRARSRLYRWLAAGAVATKKGQFSGDLTQACTMGWNIYEHIASNSEESTLQEFHFLKNNPFITAQAVSTTFNQTWLGPVMLVPANKHYSWLKAATILGFGEEAFWPVETNEHGRLCLKSLKLQLLKAQAESRPVLMVVSVAGTTELGEFDPVDGVQDILDQWCLDSGQHIWHHVDAAYGGFFCTLKNQGGDVEEPVLSEHVRNALNGISRVNSLTIDPHKLGYVPYASGAFLCSDKRDYWHTAIKAPYIEFEEGSRAFEPGPQTLEGSRSAAGAVSTWLTANVIGFGREGYGRIVERSVHSAEKLIQMLVHADDRIRVNPAGDSNIVTFCVAEEGEPISKTNERSLAIYKAFSPKKNHSFVVSKTALSWDDYQQLLKAYTSRWNAKNDSEQLVLIRLVLMNPFFDTIETNVSYPEAFIEELKMVLKPDFSHKKNVQSNSLQAGFYKL